jgi:hypothetical protein
MAEQRQDILSIGALRFPFVGAREDGEPFEYLLMEINHGKAVISISHWMVNHTNLNPQEKVDLFIPSFLSIEYGYRHHTSAIITSVKQDDPMSHTYEATFINGTPLIKSENWSFERFAQSIPAELPLVDMLFKLIKDSLILKQGILVYLKHLAPYFSRITDYSEKDYETLENFLFEDIKNRIKKNENSLKDLYVELENNIKKIEDISLILNLEDLRESMESEISIDLFLLAFNERLSRVELMKLISQTKHPKQNDPKYKYMNYLIAIKELEKRLYSNYNQIVLIYLKSI